MNAVLVDLGLGVGVVLAVSAAISSGIGGPGTHGGAGAYLFAVALGALMLVRRRWPVPVLLATLAVLTLYYALGYPAVGIAIPTAAALYSVAEGGRLRFAAFTAATLLVFSTSFRIWEGGEDVGYLLGYELVTAAVPLAAVVALGDAVRSRRERDWLAEVEREQEAARRVEQERVRIARELHDVLAHTVSVISVQADVAAEALPADPREAQAALAAIRTASREALGELRTTLGLLRGPAASESRGPVPGLAQLDRIVETAADGGLDVAVEVEGTRVPLPVVIDAAAHRIVQESITNVLRHAAADRAEVRLCYAPAAFTLRVTDDGRGGAVEGDGYGIRGMRERVTLLGGRFRAGPRGEGGFGVEATFPLEAR